MSVTTWEVLADQFLISKERNVGMGQETTRTLKIKEEEKKLEPDQMTENQAEPEPPQVQVGLAVLQENGTLSGMLTPAEETAPSPAPLIGTKAEPEPLQNREEKPDPVQIKKEQEDLCRDEGRLVMKQEADDFMDPNRSNEPEPNENPFPSHSCSTSMVLKPEVVLKRCDLFPAHGSGSLPQPLVLHGPSRTPAVSEPTLRRMTSGNMAARTKNLNWSVEETRCLASSWACPAFQAKIDRGVKKEKLYGELVQQMGAAGFCRSKDQIINKLKKMKKEYRDARNELASGGAGYVSLPAHYAEFHSILGGRSANLLTEAPESRETPAASPSSAANQEDSGTPSVESSTSQIKIESSLASDDADQPLADVAVETLRRRGRKRKKNDGQKILEYFQRSDARAEEREERMLLHVERMGASIAAMLGLVERMVRVMEERQAQN